MTRNRSGLILAAVFALSTLLFACTRASEAPGGAAPADTASVGAAPSELAAEHTEAITREMDTQVARAVKPDSSRVHVDLSSRAGAPLFSVDIQSGDSDEAIVQWSIPPEAATSAAGGVTQGSLPVPLEDLPTLDDSINLAGFVQARVLGSINGQDYDNWGCDLPNGKATSCGRKGKCCDVHDACYARNRCSASSWWNPLASNACKACNGAVVRCIATKSPGPSVCCARGNCGRPR